MCVPEIQTIESGRGSQIHTKRLTRRKSSSCEFSETKNTHHLLSLFTAKCVSLSASSTFSFSFLLTLGSLVGTFLPLVPPLLVQFPTILVTAALAGKVPLCPPFQLTQDDQLAFYNPPNDSSWSLGPNKHQAAEFKCRSSKNHIKFL